jgi:hypothetical protein
MSPVVALTTAGETRWMGGVSHGAVVRSPRGKDRGFGEIRNGCVPSRLMRGRSA